MATAKQIQALSDARINGMKAAFDSGDVDKIMSWFSKDIRFEDTLTNKFNIGYDELKAFYNSAYITFSSMKIAGSHHESSTPEFSAWEIKTEATAAVDDPALGAVKVQISRLNGASLLWWRWEGEREWDGEGVEGWKIWRQHDYFVPVKDEGGQ